MPLGFPGAYGAQRREQIAIGQERKRNWLSDQRKLDRDSGEFIQGLYSDRAANERDIAEMRESGADRRADIAGRFGLESDHVRGGYGLESDHVRGGYGLRQEVVRGRWGATQADITGRHGITRENIQQRGETDREGKRQGGADWRTHITEGGRNWRSGQTQAGLGERAREAEAGRKYRAEQDEYGRNQRYYSPKTVETTTKKGSSWNPISPDTTERKTTRPQPPSDTGADARPRRPTPTAPEQDTAYAPTSSGFGPGLPRRDNPGGISGELPESGRSGYGNEGIGNRYLPAARGGLREGRGSDPGLTPGVEAEDRDFSTAEGLQQRQKDTINRAYQEALGDQQAFADTTNDLARSGLLSTLQELRGPSRRDWSAPSGGNTPAPATAPAKPAGNAQPAGPTKQQRDDDRYQWAVSEQAKKKENPSYEIPPYPGYGKATGEGQPASPEPAMGPPKPGGSSDSTAKPPASPPKQQTPEEAQAELDRGAGKQTKPPQPPASYPGSDKPWHEARGEQDYREGSDLRRSTLIGRAFEGLLSPQERQRQADQRRKEWEQERQRQLDEQGRNR